MIPHVQGLHDKYKDKGLVVMAPHCQAADRETLEMFLLKRGVTYPVAVKADTSDYPGKGIPRGAIVDVDGKIVWQGHPGSSEFEKLLEKELERVDLYGEKLILQEDKALGKKVYTAVYSGKLGTAWNDLQKAKAKEGAPAVLDTAIERLKTRAEAMLAHAKTMVEAGDYMGAEAQCSEIEKSFKGSEFADQAKELKKEIKAKPDYKNVSTAGKMWAMVEKQASDKAKNAVALAQQLQARFGDTYYGKQADKVVRLLEASK